MQVMGGVGEDGTIHLALKKLTSSITKYQIKSPPVSKEGHIHDDVYDTDTLTNTFHKNYL